MTTAATAPKVQGPIALAAVLTAVAGFVDAHIFVHVTEVFVANQSGNVVLFGIFLGERRWPEVAAHLLSITMFALGVALGTTLHDRRRAAGLPLRPDLVLIGEAVLLAVLIVLRVIDGTHPVLSIDALDYPVILLGALAMGIQTVVIGKVGSVAVATTYESGAVARMGEEAALAGRSTTPTQRRSHLHTMAVVGTVVASYALGATFAAAADRSTAWLLLPLATVLACAAAAHRLLVAPAAAGDAPPG